MQRQVDTGGNPGAGPDAAIFNKYAILFYPCRRGRRLQTRQHIMMGGTQHTIQQSRLRLDALRLIWKGPPEVLG